MSFNGSRFYPDKRGTGVAIKMPRVKSASKIAETVAAFAKHGPMTIGELAGRTGLTFAGAGRRIEAAVEERCLVPLEKEPWRFQIPPPAKARR